MPTHLTREVRAALARARRERRPLLEPEAYLLARALELLVPDHRWVPSAGRLRSQDLSELSGDQVVVKAVAPGILHKARAHAVRTMPRETTSVQHAMREMEDTLAQDHVLRGFLVCERIEHDRSLGGELLFGIRWTPAFGPVVMLGPGGTEAEQLADRLDGGRAVLILSPALPAPTATSLGRATFVSTVCASFSDFSNLPPRFDPHALAALLTRAIGLAQAAFPHDLDQLEINPLIQTTSGLMGLDAVAWPTSGKREADEPDRPLDQIRHVLEPRSIAVVGVSATRMNPGRLILHRLLAANYEGRISIIKPNTVVIDGCRCVPGLESLDAPVDLLVLSLAAPDAVALLEQVAATGAARSVLLIPGGLEEGPGTGTLGARVRRALRERREAGADAPVVNGGNCLGVRSVPGRVDTRFIPLDKLPLAAGPGEPLAVISQSGAFAIALESRWGPLAPRYVISVGNQTDLTVGDYLTYLAGMPDLDIFACYVEGFRAGDGRRFLDAALRIRENGRAVVLYTGGRTPPGATAATSHTAAIAGSYLVTRELTTGAGVLVADSLDDFTDLIKLLCRLPAHRLDGRRLGALSNAGFECVTMADAASANGLALAPLTAATRHKLQALLAEYDLDTILRVQNPLDVSPILDDRGFAAAAELMLLDETVDVAVIGCVPLTDALHTLPPFAKSDIANRLGHLLAPGHAPWVAVVDGGPLYDPMADALDAARIPVFRSADRAVRLLARLVSWRESMVNP